MGASEPSEPSYLMMTARELPSGSYQIILSIYYKINNDQCEKIFSL